MIPKILHFSCPAQPSASQQECIDLARSLHPDWKVRIWPELESLPESRLARYTGKPRSGAQLADLIRIDAVFSQGGFYLDADMYLQRPLDPLCALDTLVCCSEDGRELTNAFFAAPPRDPALKTLIDYLCTNEPDWTIAPNVTTGPRLFGNLLRYRQDIFILPRECFYPYHWTEKRPASIPELSFGVHEWAGSWRSAKDWAAIKRRSLRRAPADNWFKSRAKRLIEKLQPLVRHALPPEILRLQPKSYPVSGDVVTETIHGIKMVMPSEDLTVVPSIVLNGTYEISAERFVAELVCGGDWVVDVGANVGLFSLLAASRCGPFGRVFAIEADGDLCGFIERSKILNWFVGQVVVLNRAATEVGGTLELVGTASMRGGQRVSATRDRGTFDAGSDRKVHVVGAPLDQLFPIDLPIRLLKIDVEGHEVSVLRGAIRLLSRRCVEYVMVEVSPDTNGLHFVELIGELRKLVGYGYEINEIAADGSLRASSEVSAFNPYLGHKNIVLRRIDRPRPAGQ